jgi:hypothetical protein
MVDGEPTKEVSDPAWSGLHELLVNVARPDGPLTGAERGLVDNLRRLADRATPLLRRLSEGVPGFAAYTNRLHESLRRLDDGEREYFCVGPDSFQTVCSQLHEELLLCLGLDRRDEPNQ